MKTKKIPDAIPVIFPVVARPYLCYVSESKGFGFCQITYLGDGDGGGDDGGDGRISGRGPGPYPIALRDQISRSGTSPHSDFC